MTSKEQKEYWIPCPVCKELSDVKVYEDTVLLKFPNLGMTSVKTMGRNPKRKTNGTFYNSFTSHITIA